MRHYDRETAAAVPSQDADADDGPVCPRLSCRPAAPCPASTPNPCPRCAALRAAAPALLAELKRQVRRCRGRMADPRYPAWHDGCCDEARALIARLEGVA